MQIVKQGFKVLGQAENYQRYDFFFCKEKDNYLLPILWKM